MRRSKRRFGDRILGILLTFTICFSGSSGLAFGAEQPDTDGFMAPGAASTADTESDALDAVSYTHLGAAGHCCPACAAL